MFEIPELINKTFDILPKIIEKNPDFVKYYLDGEEREQEQLPLRFGMLPDGQHDLRIHATDIVGNEAEKTLDRKSTRLNSSHVVISYAVFCLKKKSITI